MRFSAATLATTVGGTLAGSDVLVEGVSTDSRSLAAGQLFVPLVGQRDGHGFIADAITAGAPAYLTAEAGMMAAEATAILVNDTGAALADIARAARARLGDRVIGVTGSVGKTTVKDLIAGVLSTTFCTSSSQKSFNNEIGVPLTLANATDDAEAVVVEMGARGKGHIHHLCEIARPTIGVVTRVGLAHTQYFGSIEGVAAAKAELVESIPSSGTAVLNADDPLVLAMRDGTKGHVILYGTSAQADVTARNVVLDHLARPSFRLLTPVGTADVKLALLGAHQVSNALATAAAALAAGVPFAVIASGLATVTSPEWRMSLHTPREGVIVVDDTYNANPTSARAALETLAAIEGSRRIAVLGEMAELGPTSASRHQTIAKLAAVLGIEVIAYRTESYGIEAVGTSEDLLERILPFRAGDVILVKGSRAAGLEAVVGMLLEVLKS